MESIWIDLSSTITIVVASTGIEFVVHRHVACAKSPFVAACLKEHTKEAREQKVEVQEWDDDDSTRTLIVWMYQGKSILCISASLLKDEPNTEQCERVGALQVRLTKLYLLADRFLIRGSKNNIVDCFYAITHFYTTYTIAVRMLLVNGPCECQLKSVLTYFVALRINGVLKSSGSFSEEDKQEHRQLADVPIIGHDILQLLVEGIPNWQGICHYHEHDADDSAKRCGNSYDWVKLEDDMAMRDATVNAKDQRPATRET